MMSTWQWKQGKCLPQEPNSPISLVRCSSVYCQQKSARKQCSTDNLSKRKSLKNSFTATFFLSRWTKSWPRLTESWSHHGAIVAQACREGGARDKFTGRIGYPAFLRFRMPGRDFQKSFQHCRTSSALIR